MNDYIAKPVDERLLYKKIVDLLSKKTKKQLLQENNISGEKNAPEPIELKYTDLAYLNKRTKSNPELMMKMIQLYLDQTPVLIAKMTDSLHTKDWVSLSAAAHKMIPSFAIVGIQKDFEIMAAKIQEFAKNEKNTRELTELVSRVENACNQACKELIIEYNILKTKN